MKAVVAGLAGIVVLSLGAVAGLAGIEAADQALSPSAPSAEALAEIPPGLIEIYQGAATACEGLPWQVIAAVFWAESRHGQGRVDPATGDVWPPIVGPALDGRPGFAAIADPSSPDGWAHALGPGQFLPQTWARWARLAPERPPVYRPNPHNIWDAAYTAGAKLCAGAAQMGDLRAAILGYNRSESYYQAVWAKAIAYGMAPDGSAGAGGSAQLAVPGPGRTFGGDAEIIVRAALSQLGVPYRWGGATPGRALDCSGLVLVSYRAVGIELPRTTAGQIAVGAGVEPADGLVPGDLLFFRGGRPTRDLGHVAVYAGDGLMVIAPRTGDVVSLRAVPLHRLQAVRRVLAGS